MQTVARRGYRFIPELQPGAHDGAGADSPDLLQVAAKHFERGAWREAAAAFEQADSRAPLAPP